MDQSEQERWPAILDRYVKEVAGDRDGYHPTKMAKRYHGEKVTVWYGRIHVDDIEGWVDNVRMRHYLKDWRRKVGNPEAVPSTEDIYRIMLEADDEEPADSKKPFHIRRMAKNIAENGIQEPIFVAVLDGKGKLWDGNRRRYGTHHIMVDSSFAPYREEAQWIPAYVYTSSGDPQHDDRIRHKVLTELNFKEKDHIPWPTYVKAEQIWLDYKREVGDEENDPAARKQVLQNLAGEYGLKGWRQAQRWVKMMELAQEFKEYQETENELDETEVDLGIQQKFEYFDELTKPGVWGALQEDPDNRDKVFDWLWDGKFQAFADVRKVPQILENPVAKRIADEDYADAVKDAITQVIVDDPGRTKDKAAANEKIKQFADWLDSFRREDFRELDAEALQKLQGILDDVTKMLGGLLQREGGAQGQDTSSQGAEGANPRQPNQQDLPLQHEEDSPDE